MGWLPDLVSLLLGPTENEDDTVEYPTKSWGVILSVILGLTLLAVVLIYLEVFRKYKRSERLLSFQPQKLMHI